MTSSEAMDAVRTLVDGGGVDDVWLGAAEQGTGGYVWDDGTALNGGYFDNILYMVNRF